jgi:hypothetical protein
MTTFSLCVATALGVSWGATACDSASVLLTAIDGWTRDGAYECYARENLFDYINGAAELYLSYEFSEVVTQRYVSEEGEQVTADIFCFESPRDAFGIYSREQSKAAPAIGVGAEGYFDRGLLGFCKGRYYVKLTGYKAEDSMKEVLWPLAEALEAKLQGTDELPPPVTWFPAEGKVKRSEQYIARDFLGHTFLKSAYVAEYDLEAGVFRAFIIEAEDAAGASGIVDHYLGIAGASRDIAIINDAICIVDPHHESAGPLHLRRQGRYVLGVFNDDPQVYRPLFAGIGEHVPAGDQ